MPPPPSVPASARPSATSDQPDPSKEKKPLASMLPEKYKGINVKELFPEFRPNAVLRFSRLFPIKPSHKLRVWKNVKKRMRQHLELQQQRLGESSESKGQGWKFNYLDLPDDREMYEEDQAERFHKPKEEVVPKSDETEKESEKRGPKQTDWRWGPAQYWYVNTFSLID